MRVDLTYLLSMFLCGLRSSVWITVENIQEGMANYYRVVTSAGFTIVEDPASRNGKVSNELRRLHEMGFLEHISNWRGKAYRVVKGDALQAIAKAYIKRNQELAPLHAILLKKV